MHTDTRRLLGGSLFLAAALCTAAGCGDDDGAAPDAGLNNHTDASPGDDASPQPDAGSNSNDGGSNPPNLPGPVQVPDYEAICATRSHADCYYVSNSGNYPAGTAGHHLTMAEVSTQSFAPGDIILFARGDVWRQETNDTLIEVPASGTTTDWIQFGAYGTGAAPAFYGSIQATSWTNTSGNVWQSSTVIPDNPSNIDSGAEVFFVRADGSALFGHHESGSGGLDRAGDWTWSGDRVSVYATADPATLYASVEVPQARRLIALNDQEYIGFDSLTLRYMVNAGLYDRYANGAGLLGLRVTNTEIGNIGVKGSSSAYGLSLDRSEITIAGCTIHDCGRRSVSLVLYATAPSVIRDVVIESTHFYNGFHTTGVDIQSNTPTSGGHTIEDIVIRGNLFEGDPDYDIQGEDGEASNHIYTNVDSGSTLQDIYIYNNLFTFVHGSGIKTSGGENYYIYNNTFYGFNATYDNYQAHIFGGDHAVNTFIVNNVFYNDAPDNRYACIEFGDGREGQYTIDRNLYFAADYAHARLLWVDGGTSYFLDDPWSSYTSATGFDANSPSPADPAFTAAPADLTPLGSSPAVGAGVHVDWITTDYYGVAVTSPPDLGAIQH